MIRFRCSGCIGAGERVSEMGGKWTWISLNQSNAMVHESTLIVADTLDFAAPALTIDVQFLYAARQAVRGECRGLAELASPDAERCESGAEAKGQPMPTK